MARIQHVKKAQQRYRTVPVLDAEGKPTYRTIARKTKSGREVRVAVTVEDKTQPLPPRTCEHCRDEIAIGTPYQKVSPARSATRYRHEACPTWQPWDLSSALWAQIARAQADAHDALDNVTDAEATDDYEQVLTDFAEAIRELAEGRRESAQNIEDGFGHSTYQSEELEGDADNLDGWADELESPDLPQPPDEDDYAYDDEGDDVDEDERSEDPAELYDSEGVSLEDAYDTWRDEIADAVSELIDNQPF